MLKIEEMMNDVFDSQLLFEYSGVYTIDLNKQRI